MRYLFGLLVFGLLSVPGISHAELIVCGSPTKARAYHYLDPSRLNPFPGDCAVVDPQNTAVMDSQRNLLATVPFQHLKVVDGLLVEFTAQEKADLAAAEELIAQARQVFFNEVNQTGVCKFDTLDELVTVLTNRQNARQAQLNTAETNVQTQIDGITGANLAAALTSIRAALTQMKTIQFNIHEGLLNEMYLGFNQLGRCDLAKSKVGSR